MTITDLNIELEKEFGWLTPDEKQKLHRLLINTWNNAIDESIDEIKNSNYPEADPAYEVLKRTKNLKL